MKYKYKVLCKDRGVFKCVHRTNDFEEALKIKEVMQRFYSIVIIENTKNPLRK